MALQGNKTVLFSSKGSRQASRNTPQPDVERAPGNAHKVKKRFARVGIVLVILAGLYCLAVFSNIPFIKNLRDIYIETAMDTLNHKWLATYFIPASVIEKTMSAQDEILAHQQGLESAWDDESSDGSGLDLNNRDGFFKRFSELNPDTFDNYVDKHPEVLKDGYAHLLINKAGLHDGGTSIKTVQGDQVVAIDAENGLLIVKVTGEGYVGKLAIVKNPAQVKVGVASSLGSSGKSVGQIADKNDAVLAINASGFADYQAMGNGGKVIGLLIADGKEYSSAAKGNFFNVGFGLDNRLYIGVPASKMTYRDAVQFYPALIVNGVNVIEDKTLTKGSAGFGIQPRTAIGQAEDGTVLLLTVDGRKIGYSIGCYVTDCADILERYGAVQASNLDGGSSTVMVYRGKPITDPADSTDYGRLVPDAFIVTYADGAARPDKTSGGTPAQHTPKPESSSTASASPDPSAAPEESPSPEQTPVSSEPSPSASDSGAGGSPSPEASPDVSPTPSDSGTATATPSPAGDAGEVSPSAGN